MNTSKINGFMTFFILAALFVAPESTLAQQAAYSKEDLRSFIIANVGVHQVQQQASAKFETLETKEEKMQLQQMANQQISQMIDQAGLSIEEYNEMATTIQASDKLKERTNALAQEMFASAQKQS